MFLSLANRKTSPSKKQLFTRIEGVIVSVFCSRTSPPKLFVLCVAFFRFLGMLCENIFWSLFLDDERRKKHRRKKRSGSKPEPIVWKKEIDNFHNIYAELGRYVSTTRLTRLNKNMTRVTACPASVSKAIVPCSLEVSRVDINCYFLFCRCKGGSGGGE